MKSDIFKKYIGIFILSVLIIAVYKTFDSIGIVFSYISRFVHLLMPVVSAFAIAFILFPACKKLETSFRSLKLKFVSAHCRGFAITTVYLGALAIVIGFFWILLPMVFRSITELVKQLPFIIENVGKFLTTFEFAGYSMKPLLEKITIYDVMSVFNLGNVREVLQGVAGFSKGIINVFLAIIISVYILSDRAGLLHSADKVFSLIVPSDRKSILKKYANHSFRIMYRYIYCQLLDVVIVFSLSFIALGILGVDYAPVLAMFIGVFNIIPYFGATIACTLAALLTVFTSSISKGIIVAVVLIVLQQLDANIIQPRLVRDTLRVKPFWVLFGVLVGGGLFGMMGIILAVPVIALFKTIFEDICDYHAADMKNAVTEDSPDTKETEK